MIEAEAAFYKERFARKLKLAGIARWGRVGEMRMEEGNRPVYVWPAQVGDWRFELCWGKGRGAFAREPNRFRLNSQCPLKVALNLGSLYGRAEDELCKRRHLLGGEKDLPRVEGRLLLGGWDKADLIIACHWDCHEFRLRAGATFDYYHFTDPAALRLFCDFCLGAPDQEAIRGILLDRLQDLSPEVAARIKDFHQVKI